MADWEVIHNQLQQSVKTRLSGLEKLHEYVQCPYVTREQISSFLDASGLLLSDTNFKVAKKTLECWLAAVQQHGDLVQPYVNNLVPLVAERLSDSKQEVRQVACDLLLELVRTFRPEVIMERLRKLWTHKNWKVRHGLLQFVAEALVLVGESVLVGKDGQYTVLPQIIKLLEDSDNLVRDAALECLEEIYKVLQDELFDVINQHNLRPAQLREIYARLGHLAPKEDQLLQQQQQQQHSRVVMAPAAAPEEDLNYDLAHDNLHDQQPSYSRQRAAAAATGSVSSNKLAHKPTLSRDTEALDVGIPAAAAAAPAQAAAPPPPPQQQQQQQQQRRGGYKDGGGVTADGVLPEAVALLVQSERDLAREFEQIQSVLAGGNWDKRILAMLRLEGLVKGGAAGFDQFGDLLRPMVDLLVQQLADRRSAVARQAAHVVEVLSLAMGPDFDPYTAPLLAALFKCLVITVQVVSEAADASIRLVLHHSPSTRAMQLICDALLKEKSAKLRQYCAAYLLQVIEEWDVQLYQRHLPSLEAAMQTAVMDALSDTRTAGRLAMAAYTAVLPERGVALLKRLDGPVQAKLRETISTYQRGQFAPTISPAIRPSSRSATTRRKSMVQRPAAAAPPAPAAPPTRSQTPSRSSSCTSLPDSVIGAEKPLQQACQPAAPAATAGAVRKGRKSIAGLPMRVTDSSSGSYVNPLSSIPDDQAAAAGGDVTRRRASIMPQRVLRPEPSEQQLPAAPAAAAAAVASSSRTDTLDGRYSQRSSSSKGGRPSLANMAFKVPAPPLQSESSSARVPTAAAEGMAGAQTGLSAGALRAQEQRLAAAAAATAAAAGGSSLQPASRPPTASSEGWSASERSYGVGHSSYPRQGPSLTSPAAGPAAAGGPRSMGVSKAVTAVVTNAKDWSSRVAAFDMLAEALQQQSESNTYVDLAPDMDRVLPKLLVAVDDAHFKVSLSALAAVQAALAGAPRSLESHLDKLMPLLFLKLCGNKVQTRVAAEAALKACACAYTADVLLVALTRCLDAMKQPAAKVSVMEFLVLYLGEGKAAGPATNPLHLRQWLARCTPLLLDKTAVVRQIAVQAVQCIAGMDLQVVYAAAQAAPPPESAAMQRAVAELAAQHARQQLAMEEVEAVQEDMAEGHAEVLMLEPEGMHYTDPALQPGAADMYMEGPQASHHQQQQQQYGSAYADDLAHSMAGLHVSNERSFVQQQHAAQQLPSVASTSGVGLAEGNRTVYPLLRGPSAAVSQQQQHLQRQEEASLGNPYAAVTSSSSSWRPEEQQQPFHHQQAPLMGAAAANAAGAAAAALSSTPGASFSSLNLRAPPSTSSMLPASPAPAVGLTAAPISAAAAAAAACGPGPSTPAPAAAAAAGLVTTSVLGRSFMASPSVLVGLSVNVDQLRSTLPPDPTAQARHLTVLVHRLSSRPGPDVLEELAACAQCVSAQAWQSCFNKVLAAALPCTSSSDSTTREMAYILIRQLATHQAACFAPMLDVALQPLLQGCCDVSREVLMAAHQALEALMDAVPPRTSLDVLAYKLPSDASVASGTEADGDMLSATVRCVQRAALQLRPAELMELAPGLLLPGLVAAYSHPRPDVRKVVVFCLVDVWLHIGASLTPYLESSLSSSQLKLLTIYYKRAVDAQQASATAAAAST